MKTRIIDGGWYADALPSGVWACCRHDGPDVTTHVGTLTAPDRPLYIRIADHGPFRIAGVRHGEGSPELAELKDRVVEWGADGSQWHTHAFKGCGANPVIYDHDGVLRASDCGAGIGSQGFRYATSMGLVTGDQTYGPKHGVDLFEWTDLGHGFRVGQGPDDNGAWFYDGQSYYEVIAGDARAIRARYANGVVSIACWLRQHQSAFLWATVDEIRANFPAKASPRLPKPTPVPTPTPEPTPTPMPMPDSLLADLQAERAKYPDELEFEHEASEILNSVAWKHRVDGWGLSAKPSGNHVFSRAHGVFVAYDILHHKPTDTLWDVATGEWVNFVPQWSQAEHHHNPDRPWLAPVQPLSDVPAPTPVPSPEPPRVEPAPVACKCDLAPVVARLEAIESQLTALLNKPTPTPTATFPAYEGDLNLGWLGTKRLRLEPKP